MARSAAGEQGWSRWWLMSRRAKTFVVDCRALLHALSRLDTRVVDTSVPRIPSMMHMRSDLIGLCDCEDVHRLL